MKETATSTGSWLHEHDAGVRKHGRGRIYTPERGSIVGRTLVERGVVHIVDVLEDPEYALADLQKVAGYRTALGVPMLREGVPIGAIAVARNQVRPFGDARSG